MITVFNLLNHFFDNSSRKTPLRWMLTGITVCLVWILNAQVVLGQASVLFERTSEYRQYLQTIRPVLAELSPIKHRLDTEPALMTRQHWNALVHQFNLVAQHRARAIAPYARQNKLEYSSHTEQQGYQSAQLILETYQDIQEISAYLSAPTFGRYAQFNQAGNEADWDMKITQFRVHLHQLEAFYQLEQSIHQNPSTFSGRRAY